MSRIRFASILAIAMVTMNAGPDRAAAQPLDTDLFICVQQSLVRSRLNGTTTLVGKFASSNAFLNMIAMDTDNRTVVALDTNRAAAGPHNVIRIDPTTRSHLGTVATLPAGAGRPNWIDVDENGDYLVCTADGNTPPASVLKVKHDGSAVTTVYAGAASTTFNAFARDKSSGDLVIGDFWAGNVIQYDVVNGAVRTIVPAGSVWGAVQDPHRSTVYLAGSANKTVIGYDPVTQGVTTLSLTNVRGANCITTDRSPATTGDMIYVGSGGRVVVYDRQGTLIKTIQAVTSLGMTFDRSRNLAGLRLAGRNDRDLLVSFPDQAGKPYVVALSLAGYTRGRKLADGRIIPLELDALTFLTVNRELSPIFTGNIGTLDSGGRGKARMRLGNTVFPRGTRLWAVAITVDPPHPAGIGAISAPLLIQL